MCELGTLMFSKSSDLTCDSHFQSGFRPDPGVRHWLGWQWWCWGITRWGLDVLTFTTFHFHKPQSYICECRSWDKLVNFPVNSEENFLTPGWKRDRIMYPESFYQNSNSKNYKQVWTCWIWQMIVNFFARKSEILVSSVKQISDLIYKELDINYKILNKILFILRVWILVMMNRNNTSCPWKCTGIFLFELQTQNKSEFDNMLWKQIGK